MRNASKTISAICTTFAIMLSVARLPAQGGGGKSAQQKLYPKITRIVLRGNSGIPGSSVVVPIYFTPAQGVAVGSIDLKVSFVSANLKFDKLQPGAGIESGDVKWESEVSTAKTPGAGIENTSLKIKILPSSSSKSIPEGLLGYIILKIAETGRAAKINLATTAGATEFRSNKGLSNVQSVDAQVEVLAPSKEPAVTCFFFSH